MARIKLLGRAPLRALLIEQVELNGWRVTPWGVKARGLALPDRLAMPRHFSVAMNDAVLHHRMTGLPIALQRMGEAVTSCRRGERWT